MLMTEEEAKRRWCVGGPWAGSTFGSNITRRQCEGSQCMAWKWGDAGHHNPLTNVWERLPKGGCGLAGRVTA